MSMLNNTSSTFIATGAILDDDQGRVQPDCLRRCLRKAASEHGNLIVAQGRARWIPLASLSQERRLRCRHPKQRSRHNRHTYSS